MIFGIVKWYNDLKGYGFIACDDGSKDVFVHASALRASGLETLHEGDHVRFEVAINRNGKQQAERIGMVQDA